MPYYYDIWKLLAGVAIFLLGMQFMEASLQQMVGRPFKLFLKKQTASKPKAILGGAVVTAILQSSSVVNLMVLSFVGANVILMKEALAVILGANLGTTLSGWIIAVVGFKLNIESMALPVVAVFGISLSVSNADSLWYKWSKFLLGFGFLFIGLDYMKDGMESAVLGINLSSYGHYPAVVFLLLGFIITALIQSSAATVAIVLSALHVGAIELYAATAIILGSEVGTTIKLVLASIKGMPAKKRVALGNLVFNLASTIIVFIFLWPINRFITDVAGIQDNLIALVSFQTLVNLIGIVLFYPFLNILGKFLEKRFTQPMEETVFIQKVNVRDTELALIALENEIRRFLLHSIHFTREAFERPIDEPLAKALHMATQQKNMAGYYNLLKKMHGETYSYAVKLQNHNADMLVTKKLDQFISANRNSMYAAKSIKDAMPDIMQLRNSSNDVKYGFYMQAAEKADEFCKIFSNVLLHPQAKMNLDDLSAIYRSITKSYSRMLNLLYKESTGSQLNETEISTLINFNRESYTGYKSFIFAIKDLLLDEQQAAHFNELPGFIR